MSLSEKILNPLTNRLVNIDGKVGKNVLSNCNKVLDVFNMSYKIIYKYNRLTVIDKSYKNTYRFSRKIVEKNFGKVVEFKDRKGNRIALKYTKDDTDYKVYKRIKKTDCKTINMRKLKYNRGFILIMNSFEGDLIDYIKILRKNENFIQSWCNICEEIRKILICLMDNDIYYLDLKAENILYCDKDDHHKFYLGDLGGGYVKGGNETIITYTYKVPEIFDKDWLTVDLEKALSYLVGLLFVRYLGGINIKLKNKNDARMLLKRVKKIKINNKLKKTLLALLRVNPETRKNIRNVEF